jgi:hypothetical protein
MRTMIAPAELIDSPQYVPSNRIQKRVDYVLADVLLEIVWITQCGLQELSGLGFEEVVEPFEGFSCSDRVVHILA